MDLFWHSLLSNFSKQHCGDYHRDLASIKIQEENNSIQLTLKASGVVLARISLYREPWAFWSDSSTSTFNNWDTGQPNNHLSSTVEALQLSRGNGEWKPWKENPFLLFQRWSLTHEPCESLLLTFVFWYGCDSFHSSETCKLLFTFTGLVFWGCCGLGIF